MLPDPRLCPLCSTPSKPVALVPHPDVLEQTYGTIEAIAYECGARGEVSQERKSFSHWKRTEPVCVGR